MKLTVPTAALTDLAASGLYVTKTAEGQNIEFPSDASDFDMMVLMQSLFPKAHKFVTKLLRDQGDDDTHALIPAIRKSTVVTLLDVGTEWTAEYIYDSFAIGHKKTGILVGGERAFYQIG